MRPDLRGFGGKRVLVTGHTGFKGAWLSEWLLGLGAQFHGYSLSSPTKPALLDQLDLAPCLNHRIDDIRDLSDKEEVSCEMQPFHLTAQSLVGRPYHSLAQQLQSALAQRALGRFSELCAAFTFGPLESAHHMVAKLVSEVLKHAFGQWEDCSGCTAHRDARLIPSATDMARHALGWTPCCNFVQAIARTLSWHRISQDETRKTTRWHIEDYDATFSL